MTSCNSCGHPEIDHTAAECQHNGPEDRCQDTTPAGAVQCPCDGMTLANGTDPR